MASADRARVAARGPAAQQPSGQSSQSSQPRAHALHTASAAAALAASRPFCCLLARRCITWGSGPHQHHGLATPLLDEPTPRSHRASHSSQPPYPPGPPLTATAHVSHRRRQPCRAPRWILTPQSSSHHHTFFSRLVTMLIDNGEERLLWKWFLRPGLQSLGPSKTPLFKRQLLTHMVHAETTHSLSRGLLLFKRAVARLEEGKTFDNKYKSLWHAGRYLLHAIVSSPTESISCNLYQSFQQSAKLWNPDNDMQSVESILWLHHPTRASATPGLQFIQDRAGAVIFANAPVGQRRFIVQLALGVAHQLLAEERYADAQAVMSFTKLHFPDLVLPDLPTAPTAVVDRRSWIERARIEEEKIIELLDSLVPA
ncbi:hypothetical protein C7974DRAFT_416514 [Boeremia exigua]|uniref:uncharacterized protein n=1 Tax=Boeremia exigua TaxID=749465 RepID=UPI001E8D9E06|nr:uncharacterized protein C7974DRAFT_416514 [Boeremia exigua]KAH6616372.1 hypothetical protein C7974DRAFT_416514 [Boeremia exigua]